MTKGKKLNLILCWHMHQPDYRRQTDGQFTLPWTYLHAIKDYTDMAFHLETHPNARAVFNFVPVLLDQLEDYCEQFASGDIRDPLLALLAKENLDDLTDQQRKVVLDSCFRSNHTKMIEPYPPYKRLYDLFGFVQGQSEVGLDYLSGQFLGDLLTWYHLVWCGETVRRTHDLVVRLMSKGGHFTPSDRRQLFDLIGKVMQGLIPRYRQLAQNGQIEISTTPHNHPIIPLLIDFKVARESMHGTALPIAPGYPGGVRRATYHVESAIATHRKRFGVAPQGVWPSEGGVSQAAAHLFAQNGLRWMASGEQVLVNSLRGLDGHGFLPDRNAYLYRPYHIVFEDHEIACFFRDDRLSDMIGFEYAKWFGKDAVNDFIRLIEDIYHHTPPNESPVVSIIMDGENAWEYYPYNGYYFLSELYDALEQHPFICSTTFGEYLGACSGQAESQGELMFGEEQQKVALECRAAGELDYLVGGSWVYGNFATWIGSLEKNHAWDLLCSAKHSFDLVMAGNALSEEEKDRALKQLAVCEGSDWFWWFGDYNPAHSVESFDRLYRENLVNLYRMLKLPAPEELGQPISHGSGHPEAGGAMRRAT
ncbi:MAG: glycoside hydrolase [Sulfuricella sp.]|nr:glycoside hydrolase [Sulfuricella sp.]